MSVQITGPVRCPKCQSTGLTVSDTAPAYVECKCGHFWPRDNPEDVLAERDELRARVAELEKVAAEETRFVLLQGVLKHVKAERAEMQELLREVVECTKGAPVHPLARTFTFAELPSRLEQRIESAIQLCERAIAKNEECLTCALPDVAIRAEAAAQAQLDEAQELLRIVLESDRFATLMPGTRQRIEAHLAKEKGE